ncbi:MAG: YidC/Oxa1 family insertase periplasmic-domain containing protein [Phycisphaerales bacterium]
MSPSARRILIPLIVGLAAMSIVVLALTRGSKTGTNPPDNTAPTQQQPGDATVPPADGDVNGDPGEQNADGDGTANETATQDPDDAPAQEQPAAIITTGLHAIAPTGNFTDTNAQPTPLGSRDWRRARMLIEFSPFGAGIARITLSDIWNTAGAHRAADLLKPDIEAGTATLDQLPLDEQYVVQKARLFGRGGAAALTIPAFVARSIAVDGTWVNLFGDVWSEAGPGEFITEVHNDQDEALLRISRRFMLDPDSYSIRVEQHITNLTARAIDVQWLQYGPADMDVDRARYIDRRRYQIGHLPSQDRTKRRDVVLADDAFLVERPSVAKVGHSNYSLPQGSQASTMWPNEDSVDSKYELVWFAVENRYFTIAVHPLIDPGSSKDYSLERVFHEITPYYDGEDDATPAGHDNVGIEMRSPVHTVAAGATLELDHGVFAGPLDRSILKKQEPYASLNMGELILYQMSSWCAICTFQWLAKVLLLFLSFAHTIFFDWGVAIILLVVIVRILLHPITKRSQISMQRFGKVMQKLKPEMEKLQKLHKNDARRLQQEQMKLWREYGVSPFALLGCLPMFLQMPIWVALYAMLYFAFELRQEPAFWGIFQFIGNWPFLSDLSSGDHFFGEFAEPKQLFLWNVTGINLLPFLMGVIFFFQQKYMAPPAATMSEQQQQTQKIMRVMMVVVFPLMLYSAPSGLTLYILTSSLWGIIESRRIRKHVDALDIDAELEKRKQIAAQRPSSRDPQARAYASALERARSKRKPKPKQFKKRKE